METTVQSDTEVPFSPFLPNGIQAFCSYSPPHCVSIWSHNNSPHWILRCCTLLRGQKSNALLISSSPSPSPCPAEVAQGAPRNFRRIDAHAAELEQAPQAGIQVILQILQQYECPKVFVSTTLQTILL